MMTRLRERCSQRISISIGDSGNDFEQAIIDVRSPALGLAWQAQEVHCTDLTKCVRFGPSHPSTIVGGAANVSRDRSVIHNADELRR